MAGECVVLLGLLGYFKYAVFFLENFQMLFSVPEVIPNIVLPIGISFYTFQLLSYVVDVYRGEIHAQPAFWKLLLYSSLFHQCIAGPIVRYETVANEIDNRKVSQTDIYVGVRRFCIGLAKKAILANSCAEIADSLILPAHSGSGKPSIGVDKLPDSAQICSCFDVTKGDLIAAINKGCHTVAALKAETKAGTGCGGCIPLVTQVLNAELAKQGIEVNNNLCEHFAYSRQELFHLIRVEGIKTFEELLAKHGKGYGCEVCKPTVGSLLASCWNEYILKPEHTPLQDSNDNFLANIQKDGTYSVIPRSPGGEITPEGLMAVGRIAREFNLYTKITGSQRLAMFGAQKDDLPEIWRQLIEAGFETGHAYAKALRMAKTCVGSTWCRYGVGDSVGLGVELENRYKGIRTPHKMKFGVSGCTRECSEAQGKDVGIIATEKGWNLYVCGNGGMKPRHADLLAADIDRETLIKYLDRFMMFYIRTADKLTRTAPWLENLEGGIDYLKAVIIDDKLGLNAHLEEEMARLREAVVCEWTETVNTPSAQTRFKHFINSDKRDPNVQMVPEREQHRPATPYERIPVTLVEDNA